MSPLTYALQPLGTNIVTSHVLMSDSNKFQTVICKRQS
jgi:hypothetical protein